MPDQVSGIEGSLPRDDRVVHAAMHIIQKCPGARFELRAPLAVVHALRAGEKGRSGHDSSGMARCCYMWSARIFASSGTVFKPGSWYSVLHSTGFFV